jgi:hypothetical protein
MPPIPLRTHPKTEEPSRRFRHWKWLLLLLIPLIFWQTYRVVASTRNFNKVVSIQESLSDVNLPDAKRQELFRELRGTMSQLTSAQRQTLDTMRQKQQERDLDKYFAMNKAQQKQYLDERINRMQKAMAAGNQRGGRGGQPGVAPAGMFASGFGGGGRGGPGGQSGPGGKGPGGKARTPDEIESRMKKGLDRTSVDLRAKNDRFRKEMEQRMKERRIQPPTGRGR